MFAMLFDEYESSSAERRLELEMRYGKQVIQRAIEETKSNQWLESNSKQCPCCSTFIQVESDDSVEFEDEEDFIIDQCNSVT
ncbi:E3 ubiquitin-protein ligase rnf14 [Bulinus truncatus]|nr:E3 ubiquitin-protein ligase rnf14 [Bulinus truncatus]